MEESGMSKCKENEKPKEKELSTYIRQNLLQSRLSPEDVTAALDYKPLDGDIVLCSYPKTGSYWMQYIIWLILHKADSFPQMHIMRTELAPLMGACNRKVLESLKDPRFYRSHFMYSMMKTNAKAKYIYVFRNPEDTLVSYYPFHTALLKTNFTLDEFYEKFLTGHVDFGNYFDNVLSYYCHRYDPNMFMVSYEELLGDTRAQILRLAKFLGDDYYGPLLEDECLLEKILKMVSFDYMKQNLKYIAKTKDGGENVIPFFRKGITGDGKNVLSQKQQERLRSKILEKMKGTELIERWGS